MEIHINGINSDLYTDVSKLYSNVLSDYKIIKNLEQKNLLTDILINFTEDEKRYVEYLLSPEFNKILFIMNDIKSHKESYSSVLNTNLVADIKNPESKKHMFMSVLPFNIENIHILDDSIKFLIKNNSVSSNFLIQKYKLSDKPSILNNDECIYLLCLVICNINNIINIHKKRMMLLKGDTKIDDEKRGIFYKYDYAKSIPTKDSSNTQKLLEAFKKKIN